VGSRSFDLAFRDSDLSEVEHKTRPQRDEATAKVLLMFSFWCVLFSNQGACCPAEMVECLNHNRN
jgi:hypothetical protein